MPTYEYLCENCAHAFEEFQSITAKPLRKCPSCSKMKLKRLIGAGSGVIFKGSGFYQTDYRTENYKQGKKNSNPVKAADKKNDSSEKKEAKEAKSVFKDKKESS